MTQSRDDLTAWYHSELTTRLRRELRDLKDDYLHQIINLKGDDREQAIGAVKFLEATTYFIDEIAKMGDYANEEQGQVIN